MSRWFTADGSDNIYVIVSGGTSGSDTHIIKFNSSGTVQYQ